MKLARGSQRRPCAHVAGIAASILGGIGLAGCYIGNEGLSPPEKEFYYPTGLAVSPSQRVLYVANSDFDLQYNGGTVQALALGSIERNGERIQGLRDVALRVQRQFNPPDGFEPAGGAVSRDSLCRAAGLPGENPEPILNPGPCAPLDAAPYVKQTVVIGAFASGLILIPPRPGLDEAKGRLLLPVRGDPSVTYIDTVDDLAEDAATCWPYCLTCDVDDRGRCGTKHRISESAAASEDDRSLPQEPVGIAADPLGKAIVVAHQTSNQASLVLNDPTLPSEAPILGDVLSGLANAPAELAAVPPPQLVIDGAAIEYSPGFVLTYRDATQVDLLRARGVPLSETERDTDASLVLATAGRIRVVADGADSIGVAIDPSERKRCEARCSDDVCLAGCTSVPLRLFLAHRAPASLLIGEVRTTLVENPDAGADPAKKWRAAFDSLVVRDSVPLAIGASKIAIGHVVGEDGALHLRVFAVAFDSGLAFSYDPEAHRVESVIRTGRGPHAIALDTGIQNGEPYSFMYISHFTDSYVGVVDLDRRKPNTFGSMIVTLGSPVPPRESQ